MAWLKGFTYDGIESLDYDLYITSGSVYDAPERVVDMIKVPGRNGNLAIDRGKFENIDVEYNVYTKDRSQTSFAQNIRDFRNELCSRHEYLRLTDDYNSDEFRLGIYKSGLELDADIDRAGAIKLTFDCKPQRFLTSGETARSIPEWSDVHTDSGSLVTVGNSGGEYAVKSLSTDIEPQQDLNGYDNPWAGGAGKNKFPYPYYQTTKTANGITFTDIGDGTIKVNGTATANAQFLITSTTQNSNWTGMILNGSPSVNGVRVSAQIYGSPWTLFANSTNGADVTVTDSGYEDIRFIIQVDNGTTVNNVIVKPMIRLSSESDATWQPYENICPITGFSSANIYVSPTTSVGDATTYNVSFGSAGTVYGGTLDVVTGALTVDRVSETLTSESQLGSVTTSASYGPSDKFYCQYETKRVNNQALVMCDRALSISFDDRVNYVTNDRVYADTNTGSNLILRCSKDSTITTKTDFFNYWQGAQIVYTLATPLTYQLTATQIGLLLGTNNIWSDMGDIQIEYGKGGNTLYNPTPFDSRPLIELTGAGTLGINNYIITITGSGKLYIDCDTMEAYTITGGIVTSANNRVSLNTTDYPVLRSGMNNLSVGTGISNVKITPRWWRV